MTYKQFYIQSSSHFIDIDVEMKRCLCTHAHKWAHWCCATGVLLLCHNTNKLKNQSKIRFFLTLFLSSSNFSCAVIERCSHHFFLRYLCSNDCTALLNQYWKFAVWLVLLFLFTLYLLLSIQYILPHISFFLKCVCVCDNFLLRVICNRLALPSRSKIIILHVCIAWHFTLVEFVNGCFCYDKTHTHARNKHKDASSFVIFIDMQTLYSTMHKCISTFNTHHITLLIQKHTISCGIACMSSI